MFERAPRADDMTRECALWSMLRVIPNRLGALPAECGRVEDWDELLRMASDHGVLGLLSWALDQVGWQLPDGPAAWARERTTLDAVGQLQVRATLEKVTRVLTDRGVRCAPFKGPDVAARVYPAGVVRPCSDLDILIDPSNRSRAERALRSLGYLVERPTAWKRYESFRHEVQARSPDLTTVELHQCVNSAFGVAVPTGPLLDGAQGGKLNDVDALLAVTLHASASLFLSAKWLMDVKLMCLEASADDIAAALDHAKENEVLSSVVFGLRAASAFGAPPRNLLPSPRYRRARHWVARASRASVARAAYGGGYSMMPLVHALLCDRVSSWPNLAILRVWRHLARDKGSVE